MRPASLACLRRHAARRGTKLGVALALLGLVACDPLDGRRASLPTAQVAPPRDWALPTTAPVSPTWSPAPPTALPTSVPASPTPPPASPPPTAPSPPTPSAAPSLPADPNPATLEAHLLVLISELRARHGLSPYQTLPELGVAARAHSCDLAANHLISHQSSDGRTLQQRLPVRTPALIWPSESIAAGTDDPAQVIAMWMDEPPDGWHRRNLLDPDQQVIGAGYCFTADDPTGNRHYWTIDIARLAET